MKVKQTFMRRALDKVKNNKAFTASTALIVACTAAVVLFRQCGESQCEGPMPTQVQAVDYRCDAAIEASEFLLKADRTPVLDENGQPKLNVLFSFEDCHWNNGVCDSDPENLRTPAGNPVKLAAVDAFGRPYHFVPESANPEDPGFSMDCVRIQCGHQCGENGDEMCDTIPSSTRPLITLDRTISPDGQTAGNYWGLMTDTERQEQYARLEQSESLDYSSIESGFWKRRSYGEVCPSKRTADLQECGPLTEGLCVCPNYECPPSEPSPPASRCGDGQITGLEKCDPRSNLARNGCPPRQECYTTTTGPNACKCHTVEVELPPPPQPPPPRPPTVKACPGSVTGSHSAQMLKRRVSGKVLSKGFPIRDQMEAGDNNVMVTLDALVSAQGSVSEKGMSARCFGSCGSSRLSASDLRGIVGDVGLSGATIDAPGETCTWSIRIPITSGR